MAGIDVGGHGGRRSTNHEIPLIPFIDLTSSYVLRNVDKFPKQADRVPWRLYQNYPRDILLIRRGELEDEGIEFSRAPVVDAPERLAA